MNIDRVAFLALTASLAVGCAAQSGDDNATTSDENAITSAGGGDLCYSADESTKGYAKDYWTGQIGFDPVNDFPAAEGFCFDAASNGKKDANGFPEFDSYVYMKCNSYAKVYVPHVTYTSFETLKRTLKKSMPIDKKWDALYALDKSIAAEDFFCVTPTDRVVCRSTADQKACLRASTQMVEGAKEQLAGCLDKFDAYTCIEGTTELRPSGE